MFKAPNVAPQPQRQLPSLKGIKPQSERAESLPLGDFIVEIECFRPIDDRKAFAIVCEFWVREILSQEPSTYKDEKTGKEKSNRTEVGERRMFWFDLADEWGYGLQELTGLFMALGATEEEFDQVRDACITAENPLKGQRFGIKRVPKVAKKTGNVYAKTFFYSAPSSNKAA